MKHRLEVSGTKTNYTRWFNRDYSMSCQNFTVIHKKAKASLQSFYNEGVSYKIQEDCEI